MSEAKQILHSSMLEQAHRLFLESKFIHAAEIYQIIIDATSPSQDHKYSLTASAENRHGYYGHLSPKQLLQLTKDSPYEALGLCYWLGKDQKKAIKYYSQKSKMFGKNSAFRIGLAVSLQNMGQRTKASIQWESITAHQYLNKNIAFRQQTLAKFSQGKWDQCQQLLDGLPKQIMDLSIKAIEIYLSKYQKRSEKMKKLISNNKNAYKLYIYLAKIYEQQGSLQQSQQTLIQCITHMQNQGHFYEAPYILLYKQSKHQTSLNCIEILLNKYPNDCIFILLSAIKAIANNDYMELENILKKALLSIKKSDYFFIKEENRLFLQSVLVEIEASLKEYQFLKIKLSMMKSLQALTQLYSHFQQIPDNNLTVIRIKNPLLFKLVCSVNQRKKQGISQFLFQLYQENQNNLQLINLYAFEFILAGVDQHQSSLEKISEQLKTILGEKWLVKRQVICQQVVSQVHQNLEFKLKIKKTRPNPFKSKDIPIYFINCYHLYTCIKKINKKMQEIQSIIRKFLQGLYKKDSVSVFKDRITYKIEPNNQLACINKVIQELLPQIQQKNGKFIEQLQKQISSGDRKIPNLIEIMLKKWNLLVTQALRVRKQQKKQIECSITDWIEIEIVLPSQSKIVACINQIANWCSINQYKIVKLVDNLQKQNQIGISIGIKDIICTFQLITYRKIKEKRFKQSIRAIINPAKFMVFNVILNATKKYDYPIMSYLQGITKQLINSEDQAQREFGGNLQNFTERIECSGEWLTAHRFREILSSIGKRRQSKRVHTEVSQSFILNEQSIQTDHNQTEMSCMQSTRKKGRIRRYSENQFSSSGKSNQDKRDSNIHQKKPLKRSDYFIGKDHNYLQISANDEEDYFGDPRISQIFKSKTLKSPRNRLDLMATKRLASVNSFQQMILEDSNFEEVGVEQLQNLTSNKLKQRQDQLIERYIEQISEKQEIIIKLQQKCDYLEELLSTNQQNSPQQHEKIKNYQRLIVDQQNFGLQNNKLKMFIEQKIIQQHKGQEIQSYIKLLEQKQALMQQKQGELIVSGQQRNRLLSQIQLIERQNQQLLKQNYNKQAQVDLLKKQMASRQLNYKNQIQNSQQLHKTQLNNTQVQISKLINHQNHLNIKFNQLEQKYRQDLNLLRTSNDQNILDFKQTIQNQNKQIKLWQQKNIILLQTINQKDQKIRQSKQSQQRLTQKIREMANLEKQREIRDKQQQKIIDLLKQQSKKSQQQFQKLKLASLKTTSLAYCQTEQWYVEKREQQQRIIPKILSKHTKQLFVQQQKDRMSKEIQQQTIDIQRGQDQTLMVESLSQQLHESRRKEEYLIIFFTVIIFQAITITLLSRFNF